MYHVVCTYKRYIMYFGTVLSLIRHVQTYNNDELPYLLICHNIQFHTAIFKVGGYILATFSLIINCKGLYHDQQYHAQYRQNSAVDELLLATIADNIKINV